MPADRGSQVTQACTRKHIHGDGFHKSYDRITALARVWQEGQTEEESCQKTNATSPVGRLCDNLELKIWNPLCLYLIKRKFGKDCKYVATPTIE